MNVQNHVKELIDKDLVDEALAFLNSWLAEHPHDEEALYERGKMKWNFGDRRGALNDYEAGAALNPEGKCAIAREHSYAIMNFFNSDLINP